MVDKACFYKAGNKSGEIIYFFMAQKYQPCFSCLCRVPLKLISFNVNNVIHIQLQFSISCHIAKQMPNRWRKYSKILASSIYEIQTIFLLSILFILSRSIFGNLSTASMMLSRTYYHAACSPHIRVIFPGARLPHRVDILLTSLLSVYLPENSEKIQSIGLQ